MPVKNIGLTDRKIRLLIGLLLAILGIMFFTINQVHIAITVFAISFIPLFTSATGTCPLYCATKHSTNKQ